MSQPKQPKQHRVRTNGIELNVADQGEGPLVLLLHGFPESWYSWRHQFAPLADAGYRVVAPHMRGYGDSDKPQDIEAYNQKAVMDDIIGLIPALGYDDAMVIGHDWGAPTAWHCALNHPKEVRAVGALSVPFTPRTETAPLAAMKEAFKGRFFYQFYFQKVGKAETDLESDVRGFLRKFLHLLCADGNLLELITKGEDDDLLPGLTDPESFGDWLSDADLDHYVREFEASGLFGPLSYYRNHDLTWEEFENSPTEIHQPALYMGGDKDGVVVMSGDAIAAMPTYVKDLRVNEIIPGVGHWTQQEAPEKVNETLIKFLKETDG